MMVLQPLATLLTSDVLLRVHEKDFDGAIVSCQSIMNLARSFGDAPEFGMQLMRMRYRSLACRDLEYILSSGQPSDAARK